MSSNPPICDASPVAVSIHSATAPSPNSFKVGTRQIDGGGGGNGRGIWKSPVLNSRKRESPYCGPADSAEGEERKTTPAAAVAVAVSTTPPPPRSTPVSTSSSPILGTDANTDTTEINTTDTNIISPPKRQRKHSPSVRTLPKLYQSTHTTDLVILISDMLGELVGLNDRIPLSGAGLTRFHSRAPPTISISDYLSRLSVHASLQPSILLSMVYYIDILSTHYPPFVVSSLTVHRFLITAATVASKGLCDTFLTNSFYAKVGGLSLMELNMLELEFLVRVGWRIVPKAEVLEDYYRSLVIRMGGRYRVEDDEGD